MRLTICILLVFGLLGAALAEDCVSDEESFNDEDRCAIIAKDASGYWMAMSAFDYSPGTQNLSGRSSQQGWSTFGTGEPLNLKLGGPLSNDNYDPLAPVSCGEGVDPAQMAALVNSEVCIRYPNCVTRCPWPPHPSGDFYASELPGGALTILRLPAGTNPAEIYTQWRGEQYPMPHVEIAEVAQMLWLGKESIGDDPRSLELEVSSVDIRTVIAADRKDPDLQAAILLDATEVINRCIEKYHERHGEYPAELADLTSIPGAVIARLPYSPYHYDRQLGLENLPATADHTVVYIPETGTDGTGETAVIGYWLEVVSAGGAAISDKELPTGYPVPRQGIAWLEAHPE